MTDELASGGFAAEVLAEIDGIGSYVCGFSDEAACMTAIRARYHSDRIRVTLTPLPNSELRTLKLKKGELRKHP